MSKFFYYFFIESRFFKVHCTASSSFSSVEEQLLWPFRRLHEFPEKISFKACLQIKTVGEANSASRQMLEKFLETVLDLGFLVQHVRGF